MAFPTLEALTETVFNSNTGCKCVNICATTACGECLVIHFAIDAEPTVCTPCGWTFNQYVNGTASTDMSWWTGYRKAERLRG